MLKYTETDDDGDEEKKIIMVIIMKEKRIKYASYPDWRTSPHADRRSPITVKYK